jgi:hypothetical protein
MNAYRVLPAKRYPPHVESFLVCSSKTYQINSNYIYQARKRIITSNSKWACAAFETWNVGLSENGVPSNQLARLEPHFPNIKLHKFAINCIPHFESQLELSILLAIFISMYISVNYIPEYIYIYTGWWFQPLWKIWKSVGIIVPNIWKVIKFMFQTTTNQHMYVYVYIYI